MNPFKKRMIRQQELKLYLLERYKIVSDRLLRKNKHKVVKFK